MPQGHGAGVAFQSHLKLGHLSKDTYGCGGKDPNVRQQRIGGRTDLPTGFGGETTNLHPMRGASRTRGAALVSLETAVFSVARATGELDRQAFAHKSRSILL